MRASFSAFSASAALLLLALAALVIMSSAAGVGLLGAGVIGTAVGEAIARDGLGKGGSGICADGAGDGGALLPPNRPPRRSAEAAVCAS